VRDLRGGRGASMHVHDVALLSRTPLIMTFANAHSDDVIKRRASDEEGGGQVDFSSRAAAYKAPPLFYSATAGALLTPRRVTRAFFRHCF
jgi:hypothetical protein